MNNKFLDKVVDQILSETRIDGKGLIHFPFYSPFPFSSLSLPLSFLLPFISYSLLFSLLFSHCKEVYSLNEQEIDYVWEKYKKVITTLINDKEPAHQEKG
jgi:hypothetical protein